MFNLIVFVIVTAIAVFMVVGLFELFIAWLYEKEIGEATFWERTQVSLIIIILIWWFKFIT